MCDRIEVLSTTSGTIDARFPLGLFVLRSVPVQAWCCVRARACEHTACTRAYSSTHEFTNTPAWRRHHVPHGILHLAGKTGEVCGWLIMPEWFYHIGNSTSGRSSRGGTASARSTVSLPRVAAAQLRRHQDKEDRKNGLIQKLRRNLLMYDASGSDSGSGSGSGGGSGSVGGSSAATETPFLASVGTNCTGMAKDAAPTRDQCEHMCSGALIAPLFAVTTASCVAKVERKVATLPADQQDVYIFIAGEPHRTGIWVRNASTAADYPAIHPSYALENGHSNDIALVHLAEPSYAMPAKMYEGGDLGIKDCRVMTMSIGLWDSSPEKVRLVKHQECQDSYHWRFGSENDPALSDLSGGIDGSEVCVTGNNGTDCVEDLGLPLYAKVCDCLCRDLRAPRGILCARRRSKAWQPFLALAHSLNPPLWPCRCRLMREK